MTTRVFTDTRNLNNLIRRLPQRARDRVRAVAFQVEALAKMKAPVDTGSLRNSIYTSLRDENNPPEVATEVLPNPDSELTAFVGPSVEYGIYQELGTSTMDAKPYLLPALRQVEQQLEEHFRNIADE